MIIGEIDFPNLMALVTLTGKPASAIRMHLLEQSRFPTTTGLRRFGWLQRHHAWTSCVGQRENLQFSLVPWLDIIESSDESLKLWICK